MLSLAAVLAAATVGVQATGSDTFNPSSVTVNQGDTVTWSGLGDHNVHFADGPDSGFSRPTYSRTFSNPGTFSYVCDAHSGMRGTVVVQAATPSPQPGPTPAPQPAPQPPTSGDGPVGGTVKSIRLGRRHLRFVASGPVIGQATILRGRTIVRFVRFNSGPGLVKVPLRALRPKHYRIALRYNGKPLIRKTWLVK